jgi:excisionase family DNA binding protein
MACHTISEAASITGVNRRTIYRYIKSGKVSATVTHDNKTVIDTSELLRVFGSLSQPETTECPTRSQENTPEYVTKILAEMSQMRSEIERLTGKVEELQTQLALPAPKEAKKVLVECAAGNMSGDNCSNARHAVSEKKNEDAFEKFKNK